MAPAEPRTMMTAPWDHPAIAVRGALDLKSTEQGLTPWRLPAWAEAQMPDVALNLMAGMPSGVRVLIHAHARRIELDVLETGLQFKGLARRPVTFDLHAGGELISRAAVAAGPTLVVDNSRNPPAVRLEPGVASTVIFEDLPEQANLYELWLPQSAAVELRALRLSGVLLPLEDPPRRHWVHYGSSISHGMEAFGPSETWPAVAARRAGVELTNLGFAGQCHLDGLVARAMRDLDADLISLKVGVNVLNADSMRERVFIAAAHSFLDTLREARPATPILVISPILCPVAEESPGPTISDGHVIRTVARPEPLRAGALTAQRIRRLLASIVERRREAGDANLYYMDGLTLFGEDDLLDLPDGLHPNARGLRKIGERFAAAAFGEGGPFAAL